MKHAKRMMGMLVTVLMLSLTVTVWAVETQKKVALTSNDGKTKGEGTITAVWAWLEKDTGIATTIISAESQDIARGVVVSEFGYQNGDVVCSGYQLKDISVNVTVRGNCDEFRSFHALTVSGTSTTPLGSNAGAWQTLEYWK